MKYSEYLRTHLDILMGLMLVLNFVQVQGAQLQVPSNWQGAIRESWKKNCTIQKGNVIEIIYRLHKIVHRLSQALLAMTVGGYSFLLEFTPYIFS